MKHNVNTGFKLIFIFALLFLISMWISLGACDNSLIDLVEKDIIGGVSEISIKKGITDIPSGSIEDIGSAEVDQPGDPKIETFTVLNTGSGYLELTGSPIIIIDTANSNEFNIGIPPNSTIAPGTNSTFTIEFTPEDSAGVRSAILSIDNNDSDENPYTFFLAAIATLVPDPPEAPTGMSAGVVSSDQINVSWSDNSDNEDSFVLERRVGLVGDYEPVPESPLASNTTWYQDSNLDSETAYYYRVCAVNSDGSSSWAGTQGTTPSLSVPTNLEAKAITGTTIKLSWTDNSLGESAFEIELSQDGGPWITAGTAPADAVSYSDDGLFVDTDYEYRMRASDPGGSSVWSSTSSATTTVQYAFIACGTQGLQVIDIADPAAPAIIGSCNTAASAYGIAVSGSYAYVAVHTSGLQVIDVTDPANPVIVGTCNTPGYATSVEVQGSYAYVGDYHGLQILDVSDPTDPVIVGAAYPTHVHGAGFLCICGNRTGRSGGGRHKQSRFAIDRGNLHYPWGRSGRC